MSVIFLSNLFLENQKISIENNSKGNIQYAANTLQWNFVKGIVENLDSKLEIINAPLVGSYPLYYKKILLKKSYEIYNKTTSITSVAYINLAIFKNLFIKKALQKQIKLYFNNNNNKDCHIIVYGMLAPWVLAAIDVKKKYPNIKLCLIVPDLPEHFGDNKSKIQNLRKKIQPDLYKYIPLFDTFVFLTSEMAKHFEIKNKPWIVIEGMVNPEETFVKIDANISNKKIILYTGTLAERYGILDLLESFSQIEGKDFELWICGAGDTEGIIKLKAEKDNRIKYWGLLPREQILDLQRKATVLINPRNAEGEYTKYSFPSKIMEYMLSGTPCIVKALPGIPIEYYNYLYVVENNDILSLKNKIVEVCNKEKDELIEFGKLAQGFVLNEKNYSVQTKKMIEMLKLNN